MVAIALAAQDFRQAAEDSSSLQSAGLP